MNAYTITRAAGARLRSAALLALLGTAACSPDEILSVTDPDVVNAAEVRSADGANGVRIGALSRLNAATSGGESLFLLGGLLADEYRSGDTFTQRNETDQRNVGYINANVSDAMRFTQRARVAAQQAIDLLAQYDPEAPARNVAEMYFVQAYTENLLADHFCSGIVLSTVKDGVEIYGSQLTGTEVWERALAHADSGLALFGAADTTAADRRVRYALQVTKGRILLNLERYADAAAAVAGVPTDFRYEMQHSSTSRENQIWALNNSARRWTVSNGEGGPTINYATANDPRVPVCRGGDTQCRAIGVTNSRVFDSGSTLPLYAQRLWPTRDASVVILSGIEARLVEAEAQLESDPTGATTLATLNTLRASAAATGVSGLTALTPQTTEAARVTQLFRERAFWLFSRGTRLGDMRRLMRQYDRTEAEVFPTGAYVKGGNYGTAVNFPIPQAEENNPNVPRNQTCLDREP